VYPINTFFTRHPPLVQIHRETFWFSSLFLSAHTNSVGINGCDMTGRCSASRPLNRVSPFSPILSAIGVMAFWL
jgi:hypothetical protein